MCQRRPQLKLWNDYVMTFISYTFEMLVVSIMPLNTPQQHILLKDGFVFFDRLFLFMSSYVVSFPSPRPTVRDPGTRRVSSQLEATKVHALPGSKVPNKKEC